jgi:hypothetical protein
MVKPFPKRPPSGATAQVMSAPSPLNVAMTVPLSRSHTFSVPSYEPEIAHRPSGLTATALTPLLCPLIDQCASLVGGDQFPLKPIAHIKLSPAGSIFYYLIDRLLVELGQSLIHELCQISIDS